MNEWLSLMDALEKGLLRWNSLLEFYYLSRAILAQNRGRLRQVRRGFPGLISTGFSISRTSPRAHGLAP
ncbi:MAG: hypothetical protein ACLT9P_03265 [Evtepia gabavorous]